VDRELPIVDDVPDRVARLEEPRALNQYQRARAAEVQPSGDLPRFALAAGPNQTNRLRARQCGVPLADRAVGNANDGRDPEYSEEVDDLLAGGHRRLD